jgi:hypothetical protein
VGRLTEALRDRWSGAPPLGVGARTPALLRRCALGDLRQAVMLFSCHPWMGPWLPLDRLT